MRCDIPCVVLAGGLGTRLRSVLPSMPKCLAPVGKRSFLEIQLQALHDRGIDDFVLSLGYMAESVVRAVADIPMRDSVRYVVEEEALGTGGAIAMAMDSFGLDEALVVNGDTFFGGDLSPLFAPLNESDGERVRMATIEVPDSRRFGGVEVDQYGRVRRFVEKGRAGAGLINAGLYRVLRSVLPSGPIRSAFSFETSTLPQLARAGEVRAAQIDGVIVDIGVPEDYRRFCREYG